MTAKKEPITARAPYAVVLTYLDGSEERREGLASVARARNAARTPHRTGGRQVARAEVYGADGTMVDTWDLAETA